MRGVRRAKILESAHTSVASAFTLTIVLIFGMFLPLSSARADSASDPPGEYFQKLASPGELPMTSGPLFFLRFRSS